MYVKKPCKVNRNCDYFRMIRTYSIYIINYLSHFNILLLIVYFYKTENSFIVKLILSIFNALFGIIILTNNVFHIIDMYV